MMSRWLRLLLVSLVAATAPAAPTVRVKNLNVLGVIYRGEPAAKDHMDDSSVFQARNGGELGRLFYFRNSRARLNCELHWLVIDEAPPKTDGPTMEFIEADLRQRGVKPGEYDGVFVTGVGLAGNWGGFEILGGAGGCFGGHDVRGNLTWYPEDDPDVAYGTAWNFVHEFQHALDLVICEKSGRKDMLHDHPYTDRNEPYFKGNYRGGEHFDWVAVCLREFDAYLDLKGVANSFLECTDADGDALPDDDPRLPMDEKRFGSDAGKKDTDSAGLDDLGEFTADRYVGSDPNQADTDGDGVSDGEDPYPVVAIRPLLQYTGLVGDPDKPEEKPAARGPKLLLDSVFARNDGGGKLEVYGGWEESALRLWFHTPRKCVVHAKIDGSAANGFWEGGDTYLLRISDKEVKFDGLGLSGAVPGARVKHSILSDGQTHLLSVLIPAKLGQGVSKEINYGGKREPGDVVDGLTLVDGRTIAFNLILEFEDGKRAALTPHHTMYAVRLLKPATSPEVVLLRGPARTSAAVPRLEVLGARATTRVDVVTEGGQVVGRRIGPGPVLLVGLSADGTYRLAARTEKAKSEPHELLVDRVAAPPNMNVAMGTGQDAEERPLAVSALKAVCEPNAEFELWWGWRGMAVAPVAGMRADEQGQVLLSITSGKTEAAARLDAIVGGWVVTGFDDTRFEHKVFIESWPVIDKNFEGGPADKRLPADNFAYRFEGYLPIESPGRYTFELTSDDGSRLWIDDELVIDHWGHHGMSARTATIDLSPGPHCARIDYYEEDGWAGIRLRYAPAGQVLTTHVPVRRLPVDVEGVQFFGVQTDSLGNRSGFSPPM